MKIELEWIVYLLSAPFLLSEFLHYRSKCQHSILYKRYTFALNLKVVINIFNL